MTLYEVQGIPARELARLRRQLLDGSKLPSLVIEGERITLSNEAARALLRWPSVDMSTVEVRSLFSSQGLSQLRQAWDDAHRTDTPVQVRSVMVRRTDGEEEISDVVIFPLAWAESQMTLLQIRPVEDVDRTVKALKASENRFRSFIENISDGIFQSTPEGALVLVNPALVRMLGYGSEEEVLRLNLAQDVYVDPEARASLLRELEEAGFKENVELQFRRKDGSRIVCLVNTRAVRRGGTVQFYEGTLKDITAWKQVQEELRASRERYKAFIRQSTEGIWCFELEEPIPVSLPAEEQVRRLAEGAYLKECNDRMAEMLGHSRAEEILGARMGDLFVVGDATGRAVLHEYVSNGYRLENREVYLPGGGGRRDMYVSNNAIGIVENEHLVRAWGTQQDITPRKEAESRLREAQKMETLGTLAGGVAHDFNNILTVIRGYMDMLRRDGHIMDAGRASMDAIETAVKRGAGVVRQLMTFAREDRGSVSHVEVRGLVAEVEQLSRVALPENVMMSVDVHDDVPTLMGDESQLHQAVLNLVVNARDAMPAGGKLVLSAAPVDGATVRALFPAADKELYVRISVSDEGVGLSDDTRAHMFEPFYTTKDIGKGSGLGLAVVYGVVRGHAGFVDVKPNGAHGTVFHLFFPGHRTAAEPKAAPPPPDEEPKGSETVLVVEDEEMLLDLLTLLLENSGYKVLRAKDGVEAVETYKDNMKEIAIVLSDMGLPRLGGYEAFLKMKELNPSVKSILASGYMDPAMREKLLKAGAMDFIQKPYVPDVILRSIREFMDKEAAV